MKKCVYSGKQRLYYRCIVYDYGYMYMYCIYIYCGRFFLFSFILLYVIFICSNGQNRFPVEIFVTR